ncbi:endonuclease/exonuclease/phosphatase family protein [Streptomyces sp. SAS_267]|uniref:endonuclease/exonuclease/phosphatase family protein n=1 Tax=Streptomyces sp. SAS_267 TaxID=3412750 RepID=UPI00403CC5F4
MRRFIFMFVVLFDLIAGMTLLPVSTASATDVSGDAAAVAKSAGQRWALKSLASGTYNGKFVSVRLNATDKYEWMMQATSTSVASWERFTLHTNHAGTTISLRSEVTGFFATPEFTDAEPRTGMLRARGGNLADWQQFEPVYFDPPSGSPSGSYEVAFKTIADGYAGRYVTVSDDGILRATALSPIAGTRFLLIPEGAAGSDFQYPAASVGATSLNVMTWNVCANNNDGCGWSDERAGYAELNQQIRSRLKDPAGGKYPDVIFFQEFCEKHAKKVEEMLEDEMPGRGWDVRFAPINTRVGGPLIQKQCAMGPKPDNLDRGAFGVAIAVPDENTFYQRFDFTSPPGKEQRSGLCAAIPSRAVMACTAHLSAGKGYDDETGEWRTDQAVQLNDLAHYWETTYGYRTVFGGDLNVVPPYPYASVDEGGPSSALLSVYGRYLECSQLANPDSTRTGKPTANANAQGEPTRKIDYIFAPKSAEFTRCSVSATSGLSDHWTLYGTVALPAT